MNWRRRIVRGPAAARGSRTPGGADPARDAQSSTPATTRGDETDAATTSPTARPVTRPARIVAITNQKGGVGKTTTAISVAAALADKGLSVLLVDVDPQGNASTGLELRVEPGVPSTYDVVVDRLDPRDAIVPSEVSGLSLLPSSIDLAGAEVELVAQMNRERRLATALSSIRDDYHVILLDCPPSLGMLTLNALVAADEAVVPIQTEYYALEGVTQLLKTLSLVSEELNTDLHIGGVVLTMYDARTNLSAQVANEIHNHFGDVVYNTVIPRTVRLSEAPSFGQPITLFDPSSRGARAYVRLATEMAGRWDLATTSGDPLDELLGPAPSTIRREART